MVKSSDNSVRLINMIPNIPLGYEKTFKFVEEGCMLDMDEKLVLYTDGVTEARDTERKMMGEPKWLDIVSHDDDLLEAVKRYIGEAEPTDDITLMTIRKKSAAQPISVRVPNHIEQWPSLRRTLHEYGVCVGIEKHTLKKLEIALEEAVVNVISYSHATEMELKIQRSSLNVQRPALNVTLTDNGVPFDPTSSECDTAKVIEERQIGGLGISLLRQITDEQHYQRTDEKNQLTIIKYLSTT
jgi:anti-sigma regulatory factor (Ser/Thr protein kinase)